MNTAILVPIIEYTIAYDSTDEKSRVISPEYPGRQAYVYDIVDGKKVWFLAESNGKKWVREAQG